MDAVMLIDEKNGVAYVPISLDLLKELSEWSKPVQVRVEDGELVFRGLGQPLDGVYIVDTAYATTWAAS